MKKPIKMSNEKTFIVNFNGNCMAEIQIIDNGLKVLRSIDGWGNPIDLDKITIEKAKSNE